MTESRRWESPHREFKTPDHPEAFGRTAQKGDVEYPVTFPLENGDSVTIRMGESGFQTLTNLLTDMLANRPSHDDGSIPPKS
jgi:hypothetical protein